MIRFIREQKNLSGKKVLLCADLDAPHDGATITDDFRIRHAVPTVQFLLGAGAKIVIISKVGRPSGWDLSESLAPGAARLAELLGSQVTFYAEDIGKPGSCETIKSLPGVAVLENVRFYPEEDLCDQNFAKLLASFADLYVFDAFAMAHRDEASVTTVQRFLPSYAGLNVELELKALGRVAASAEHPSLFMLGGAKISDKVATLQNLGKKVDSLLVGGGPANLFFFAKGYEVGKSICERESVQLAKDVLRNFGDKLVLPVDCVVAKADHSSIRVCAPTDVHPDEAIFDIGPASILKFAETIKAAKQMVWNGPLGLFEERAFSHGSVSIATLFAARCQGMAFGVVGGGDTLSLLDAAQVTHMVDFVSTAGGAMLAYLAGEPLPAIVALGSQNKE